MNYSRPLRSILMATFLLMVIFSPTAYGIQCYVCKTSLPSYDGPVNCPNVNNPGTTTRQDCLSGVCLTFRGSQQRNTNMIEDGVVRLCSNGENVRKIFGTSTVSIDSGETCRQVAYASSSNIHDNTAISGKVCTCTSDLCNAQFQSNAAPKSTVFNGVVLAFVAAASLRIW
ncbi:hypothetical protein BV898_14755 [Hypsibius exemplaris]|uniref:Protein sleepless n=1 Tax=Hypsibius exemplaris TaxID=2072580 RepID=A0A9X6N9G8_HYPEX|nr:hypothetical protein BV898_14755 [Hypsibius exemplaris]